jgi:hypothetical protein
MRTNAPNVIDEFTQERLTINLARSITDDVVNRLV